MLDRLKEGLQAAVKKMLGSASVDEQAVKEFVRDVQRTLLQGDVNVRLVLNVTSKIEERASKEKPPPGLPRKDHIVKILYEEISNTLGVEARFDLPPEKANVVLLMGIQGSGKTTVAAKLARFLVKRGYRPGVVCADTFRPGALTQLRMLCQSINVEVFGDEKFRDSVEAAVKGVEFFKAQGKNAILVDTAGRHKEEKSLLEEMRVISNRINPDITLLVVDGTIGQQCYAQSEAFHKAVPVGGIIVTKLDGAAKGGGALAAATATDAKIFFLGTGERVDDLETFSPTRFVGRLLGLGDIKALLERARELEMVPDEKQIKRMMSGKITINDFYYQLEQMKKMGSLKKILDLIPGFSSVITTEGLDELEGKMAIWKSIIQSMTKAERDNPDVLNASRTRRIARGSGNSEKEVKEMMVRFRQAKAAMKATGGRGLRQLMRRIAPHEL